MVELPIEYTGMIWDLAKMLGASKWQWLDRNRYVHIYAPDDVVIYRVIEDADYQNGTPWKFQLLAPSHLTTHAADLPNAPRLVEIIGDDEEEIIGLEAEW